MLFLLDLIVLDPPYGLKKAHWDDSPWGVNDLYVLLANLEQLNTNVNATFVCFCSHEMRADVFKAIERSCFIEPQAVTWWKPNSMGHGKRFLSSTELMIFAWRGGKQNGYWNYRPDEMKMRNDCWMEPNVGNQIYICAEDQQVVNPCQKPQSLLRRLLRYHSPGAGLVLDLCAGSHALMMACIAEGRSCISIECDTRQHRAAVQIVQAHIDELQSSKEKEKLQKEKAQEAQARKEKTKKKQAAKRKPGKKGSTEAATSNEESNAAAAVASTETSISIPGPGQIDDSPPEALIVGQHCAKCTEGHREDDALVQCYNCSTWMHKLCHWSNINVATTEQQDEGIAVVEYLCTRVCWLSSGFAASHVPAEPADV